MKKEIKKHKAQLNLKVEEGKPRKVIPSRFCFLEEIEGCSIVGDVNYWQ